MYKLVIATTVSAALLQGCSNSINLPDLSGGVSAGGASGSDSTFVSSLDGQLIRTADGGCLRTIDWDPSQGGDSCQSNTTVAASEPETTEILAASLIEDDRRPEVTLRQNFAGNALFASNSSNLSSGGVAALVELIDDIGGMEGAGSVEIIGHADSSGAASYNQTLSEKRAATVHDFLKGKLSGLEFGMTGMGELDPIGDNATEEGRAQNRRVEVLVRRDAIAQ